MASNPEDIGFMRDIDRRIKNHELGRKHPKKHKKDKKKDKKHDKKRELKSKDKRDQENDKIYEKLPTEYYDFTSDHGLIPALPSNNSYNRNIVLSFGHSGVKFIL